MLDQNNLNNVDMHDKTFPKFPMDLLERLGSNFTLREIEFLDGQLLLTNTKLETNEGVESSRVVDLRAQALNFSIFVSNDGLEVDHALSDELVEQVILYNRVVESGN